MIKNKKKVDFKKFEMNIPSNILQMWTGYLV